MERQFREEVRELVTMQIAEVLHSGKFSARYGSKVTELENEFAKIMGANFAIAVNSGTSALIIAQMACKALNQLNTDVAVPGVGPIMTAASVNLAGGYPAFIDIMANLKMSKVSLEQATETEKICGVIQTRLFDITESDEIIQWANNVGIWTVIDSCQSLEQHNMNVEATVYSFEQSKPMYAGDGGMIVTNIIEVAKVARFLSDNGNVNTSVIDTRWRKEPKFDSIGHNVRMNEFVAAVLIPQVHSSHEKTTHSIINLGERNMRVSEYDEFIKMMDDFGISYSRAPWGLPFEKHWASENYHNCPVAKSIWDNIIVIDKNHLDRYARLIKYADSVFEAKGARSNQEVA